MSQTNILLESGTNELEIVEFYIDEPGEDGAPYRGFYGVNVAKVLEIIQMPKITSLPEVQHPSVLGAFNLRSHIIPLVDLGQWLDKGHLDSAVPPKVVVTEFNGVNTAFMVTGVNRIHRISWEAVEPPGKYMAMVSQGNITGVIKLEDHLVFLLDLEKIVAELNPALGLRLDTAIAWDSAVQYRALIADDSSLIREMLKDLMQKANFKVDAVSNGREAWDRLNALKDISSTEGRPINDYLQVVVSDIEMPSMDGHNLCKRIKEDPILKQLPVILFSSLITDKLRHKGLAVGADEQLSKPEVTQLAHKAHELIKRFNEKKQSTQEAE
jgi:two-component system chemotaxis response regulator CheV